MAPPQRPEQLTMLVSRLPLVEHHGAKPIDGEDFPLVLDGVCDFVTREHTIGVGVEQVHVEIDTLCLTEGLEGGCYIILV